VNGVGPGWKATRPCEDAPDFLPLQDGEDRVSEQGQEQQLRPELGTGLKRGRLGWQLQQQLGPLQRTDAG
jgi:hypothetical protein